MRLHPGVSLSGVSIAAIVAATLGATGARAQSAQNITATGLVSGLSVLPNSAAGIADLNANLATALAINNGATPEQRLRATIDNTITSSNGVVVADALGSRLGALYRAASPTSAVNPGPATFIPTTETSFSPNLLQLIRQANAVSGSDSAFAKNYLANGTVTGSPSTFIGSQNLPAGGVFGAYDRIYNPPAGANTVGNARPAQARPDQTASFTQPNFFGVPANNTTDIVPTLRGNAAYPSGHTTFGQTTAILLAQLVPERFQEAVARGSEYGNSRVVLSAHYPMDVIAGRILATYDLVQLLNNNPQYLNYAVPGSLTTTSDFQALFNAARTDLTGLLTSQCGTTVAACAASGTPDRFADKARTKADYTYRLTYGFAPVGPTDLAPVVPVGAEILLATRFPYLTAAQRRDVLATTEIASGQPLDNGSGYARLNLYAAADGYGAFNGPVTVTMDASKGGFSALDSFDNDIGGTGSLTKAGTGTLVLTGTNTYAGGTTIAGGTLVASAAGLGSGAIVDNASLILDQAGDATLANAIAGSGLLTKAGAGSLSLTGTSSFSGATGVAQGRLAVNGSLAGSVVTVGSGASLGGTGTVGGLVAQTGAVVAPGNSIGTLSVAGNAGFAPGATFQVETNAAGQADRLAVAGTATLTGGTVQVQAAAGTYDPRTAYTILTANGGVQGQFAIVTANFAFLTPTLRYAPAAVDLTLTRNDLAFARIAQTRNQAGVADAIQAAGAGAALYGRTVGLTTPEARAAFGALTGDIHASAAGAQFETAYFVREALLDRLRRGASPGAAELADYGTLPAAYTADLPGRAVPVAPVPVRVLDPRVFGLWGQGFGSFGEARSDGNAAGLSRQTSGFVLGADVRLETGFRLGVAGGYTATSLDGTGRLSSGTIESGFGGLYGGFEQGPVALRLGAVYADQSSRLRRAVTFAGFSDSDTARYGGATVQGFGELGYRIVLGAGPSAPVTQEDRPTAPVQPAYLEPFVGGAYVSIGRDRFAETGGPAALTGAAQTTEVATSTVGLRGQASLDLGGAAPVSLHGLVGYRRAYGAVVPKALLSFGTGPSFLVAGTPISRDALVAGAGLDVRVARDTTLGLAYTGQVGERAQDHAVKGNFTYRF
ncbi:hypothetical protein ASF49_13575 [Methylobacterium sp. Leaf104]|uniref:autotransporter outer membrane beta-barrel domain-containing protein n=1 Tax=Methylobacterium TaxID=407 RepID=UPI0006FDF445|nr:MULTISPECIES: autotransporter domain-containing protein [Methylobacterium]KQP30535.1 hypothetical protein ASF49_13575 [Methylobacterium sp. Leaf104]MCI9882085.1 autotransporter domain-containing protein [Methylobacterium goesingense]